MSTPHSFQCGISISICSKALLFTKFLSFRLSALPIRSVGRSDGWLGRTIALSSRRLGRSWHSTVAVFLINSNQLISAVKIYDAAGWCNLRWSREVVVIHLAARPNDLPYVSRCMPTAYPSCCYCCCVHDRRYGNQGQVPSWERYKLPWPGVASEMAWLRWN